uniref:C-type lectin domain-containing protein n=1 Tax=Poecilia latipinna TaxID=48699 RepID=A0A3B3V1D6_9TELE
MWRKPIRLQSVPQKSSAGVGVSNLCAAVGASLLPSLSTGRVGQFWPQNHVTVKLYVNINMFDYSTETNTTHKYHLIEEMKSWQEAQSYCREKHTDLISGTKQLQDEEVKKLMNSTSDSSYIGLFRDTWRWSDGSSFSFRHWNKNFNNPETNSGQCAMTKFDGEGRWTNVNCGNTKPFICYDGEFVK